MFYHASNTPDIKELLPHTSNHNKPLVYLTTKRENCLVYLSNAVEKHCRDIGYRHIGKYHKWASYGFTKDGILKLDEFWPNATMETYAGVSGYIYSAETVPQAEKMTDIPFAAISSAPVPVEACEFIPDAYEALKKAEAQGLIILRKYEENSEQMLDWIRRCVKDEYAQAVDSPDYRLFLAAKFSYVG